MKLKYSFLFATIVASLGLQGQTFKYTDITPPNWYGVSFNDICFRDSLNGFAISSNGLMLRTKDAGDTWSIQRKDMGSIVGMCFKNKDTAICAGNYVYLSTDGGENWARIDSFTHVLAKISFISQKIGFATGDRNICKTSDGGKTWKQVLDYFDPISGVIQSYHFIDNNNGLAFGRLGKYFQTTNGGETWTLKSYPKSYDINDVYFFNTLHGLACTNTGQILESFDGGASWVEIFKAADTDDFSKLLHFGSSKFKVYTSSDFWQSNDSGKTWNKTVIPNSVFINGVNFTDSLNGYLVNSKGLIYRTKDGGSTWKKTIWGTPQGYFQLYFTDSLTGYVNVFDGNIIKTIDGGKNWVRQTIIDSISTNLGPIVFTSKNKGFIGTGSYVVSTDNAGASWQAKKTYNQTPMTSFFYFPNADTGYAGTDNQYGLLTKTFDGGKTWTGNDWYDIGIDLSILSASFPTARIGYVTSGNNQLSKTIDAGNNWQRMDFSTNIGPKVIHFFSKDTGIVCGILTGQILRTTDGAKTWNTVNTAMEEYIDYFTIDKKSGFVFINSNPDSVYYTANTGLTWEKIAKGKAWRYIYFIDSTYGYCTMSQGVFKVEMVKNSSLPNINATADSLSLHITPTVGNSLKVTVTTDSLFNTGNYFNVELSDASGNFTTAQQIGQIARTSGVVIPCSIPPATPSGTGYKIRVVSTSPVRTVIVASALTIILVPPVTPATITAVSTDKTQYTVTSAVGSSCTVFVTASGNFVSGNTFTAYLSDAQGNYTTNTMLGSITATSDATIACTIPANTASGTGYKIKLQSTNPVLSFEAADSINIIRNNIPCILNATISGLDSITISLTKSDTITVSYNYTGDCPQTVVPSVTLSDKTGNFAAAFNLSVTDLGNGKLQAIIPMATIPGTGYKIAVQGNGSTVTGSAFEIAHEINAIPEIINRPYRITTKKGSIEMSSLLPLSVTVYDILYNRLYMGSATNYTVITILPGMYIVSIKNKALNTENYEKVMVY